MGLLFYGFLIFLIAFFSHVIVWRIRLPKNNQSCIILTIFFGVFIVSLIILKIFPSLDFLSISPFRNFTDYLQLFILYASLVLSYICTYSAIEVDSPSLVILLKVREASAAGLAQEELYAVMNDDMLVKPRIADLVKDDMVHIENNMHRLTRKGEFLASIFIFFRRLLNAPKGG